MAHFLALKSIAVAIWFALLAGAERVFPAAPTLGQRSLHYFNNAGLWLINSALSVALITPLTLWLVAHPLWRRPAGWDGPLALLADVVVLDLWIYAWHRLNHEWSFLWRFHSVHHRDETLDTTSAVRFHFGEVALSALARAPVIWLGAIPLFSVLVFESAVLLAALFHHSNVRLPAKFEAGLRVFIVTPSHHWVHHHAVRMDTDSNYATLLTLWDRVFRSWSLTKRTREMKIGVESGAELKPAALLLSPFGSQTAGGGPNLPA